MDHPRLFLGQGVPQIGAPPRATPTNEREDLTGCGTVVPPPAEGDPLALSTPLGETTAT